MTFDLNEFESLPAARVVVAETMGSVPREVGASMVVTPDGVVGTVGGGALEFEAIARARNVFSTKKSRLDKMPLGPSLGQCCGGAVTLLTEYWDEKTLSELNDLVVRPLPGQSQDVPLSVSRILSSHRSGKQSASPGITDGWMIEPLASPTRELWVWGAGHVGRALVSVLGPLPDFRLRWADKSRDRFPSVIDPDVDVLVAEDPSDLVTLSGRDAEHLVVTFSHSLDLEICHRVLSRPFRNLGLIGSKTKKARFRSKLAALGHSQTQLDRLECPIGVRELGKHPHAIALGVASTLLMRRTVGAEILEHHA